ncbi:HNH endonuclease [Methanocalculus natronophilus]|uniref:HNH endonuclease n=1 Tax=Methanocalculus natronophilus TaxID=1262400 RepID=UPI003CCC8D67
MEIHHLVPREFSNEFQHSIEIIDNYVALCPHCHKMLHYANDRERYSALKYLFNKREVKLKNKDISLTVNEIKSYYNVNNL